jgi:hypothetical protein
MLREYLEGTQFPWITGRGHSCLVLFPVGLVAAVVINFPIASDLGPGISLPVHLFLAISLAALLGGGGFSWEL